MLEVFVFSSQSLISTSDFLTRWNIWGRKRMRLFTNSPMNSFCLKRCTVLFLFYSFLNAWKKVLLMLIYQLFQQFWCPKCEPGICISSASHIKYLKWWWLLLKTCQRKMWSMQASLVCKCDFLRLIVYLFKKATTEKDNRLLVMQLSTTAHILTITFIPFSPHTERCTVRNNRLIEK